MNPIEPTLKAVSSYLDGWSDLATWDRVAKLLGGIEWSSYADKLEKLRRGILSDIAASVLAPPAVCHSAVLDTSFSSRADMLAILPGKTGHLLHKKFNDLVGDIDRLDQPDPSGQTAEMGALKLSGAAERLCQALNGVASRDSQ